MRSPPSQKDRQFMNDTEEVEMLPLTGADGNPTDVDLSVPEDEYKVIEDVVADPNKPWNLEDFLYPPDQPRSCQLLRKENLAVPACYLLVGILQGLVGTLINVYPLDLGATEAQQTTLSGIRSLPASFKLLFGFISDNMPIGGYRRKSYMLVGWLLASVSMACLLFFADISLDEEEFTDDTGLIVTRKVAPEGAPSIPFLSFTTLLFGTGFWMADVMGDSIVAEKAKLEPVHARGGVQSSCYSYRFFGLMVSAPLSSTIYSFFGPYPVIALLSVLPLTMLPLIYNLGEVKDAPVASTKDQCYEIWTTICSRAVWQPLGFVFLYNVLQVGNAAWKEFLRSTLNFTTNQLNALYIAACVLLYFGVVFYKYFMMNWSWRYVYIVTTLLGGLFSILQVLLIRGTTFGIPNFWFALGDDAFMDFIGGIQFLPTTIMMVHLCPVGSEGASYAMFTTVNNSALNLSSAVSTSLLGIWDVSKERLLNHELSGLTNLTILTTLLQTSGILFVGLLPRTKEELFALKERNFGSSNVGGFIFLLITCCSILYAVFVGVMNIVAPGWMGES